jgi:hypothetical protein
VAKIEAKLDKMGLVLPSPFTMPSGVALPFAWVRVRGKRAYISGHIAQNPDGSAAGPFGKVGAEVTPEQGYQSARLAALSQLGSLKRALGDLDRVSAWLRALTIVNAAPGFFETPRVTNGYSDLIIELYGREVGMHARTSPGMNTPLNSPFLCEAEVEIDGG